MRGNIRPKGLFSIFLICVLSYMLSGCGEKSYFETAGEVYAEDEYGGADIPARSESETASDDATLFVQVSGAVVNPGVYELPTGSRVFEAVNAAGGVTDEADVGRLNQAETLSDGQMIYITSFGEQGEAAAGYFDDGLIDINSADASLLMTLPGIGSQKAESIVSYREQNGRFSSTDELMQISGIKSGVYEKIKDMITVR